MAKHQRLPRRNDKEAILLDRPHKPDHQDVAIGLYDLRKAQRSFSNFCKSSIPFLRPRCRVNAINRWFKKEPVGRIKSAINRRPPGLRTRYTSARPQRF